LRYSQGKNVMINANSSKPLIRQGWLRVLLYIVSLLLFTGIALVIYIFSKSKGNLSAATGLNLNTPTLQLLPVLPALIVTYIFRRWADRKSFISVGLTFRGYEKQSIAGGALAVFTICVATLFLLITGHLKWVDFVIDLRTLFLAFGSTALLAFFTELVFRGYILNNLMSSFPGWLALTISTLLYLVFNPANTIFSFDFFTWTNTIIFGLILGLNYLYSKNLWFSIFFHLGWKFFLGPVLGVSGNEYFQTLLESELSGGTNITGGSKGLEGSVTLLAASLLSLIALYLILQNKSNPQSQPVPGRI
jgi:uncharacterized protein